ncbi:MAG: hypothetical protein Kow002_21490 [Anaerolineales bacterium]
MKRILLIGLAAMLLLSACGTASRSSDEYVGMEEPAMAPESLADAPMEFAEESKADGFNNNSSGVDAAAVERKVIQNADLRIVVADPKAKLDEIQKMATAMGGFVVSSNTYQTTTRNGVKVPEGSITIRVPSEKLDEALDKIKADVVEVQNEERSGKDVTREYVDLKSRLKTHEQAAEQLSKILEQKTESSEVIEVFNQLVYHREQIEMLKGQINYIDEAAALSAISVSVIAEETLQPIEIGGWKPVGVARDALQALINFFQGFVNFLIWLIVLIIPAGLLILGALWLVWKVFRWVWKKLFPGKKKKEALPEEKKKRLM